MKLKAKDIPLIRVAKLRAQLGICPLCTENISGAMKPCLDHDHTTGDVRDVLCSNCNRMEGEIFNRARRAKRSLTPDQWLANLMAYWLAHRRKPSGVIHPKHKSDDEKRVARNTKARARRQAKVNLKGGIPGIKVWKT